MLLSAQNTSHKFVTYEHINLALNLEQVKELLLSILFISLLNLYSQAQTTAIPDPDFEAKLIQLGIDSDGLVNGLILDSDAVVVTSLQIQNSNISNLTGLQAFSALVYLDCSSNLLDSINLSGNFSLNNLNCSNNNLDSIDLSNNSNLRFLTCNANSLDSLDLSNNPSLLQLRFINNQLTNLDISNNLSLTRLACDNNQFSSLDISNNTDLVYISCSNNQLTNLDISNNSSLEILYCNNNALTSLDISNNLSLIDLDCAFNQLTNLDISNNTDLRNLNCDSNLLTSLNVLYNLNLITLDCAFNQLTSLNTSNNPNLIHLRCGENQLTSLNTSNNPNLLRLYCDNNRLTNLELSNNPFLVDLFFQDNYLNRINAKNDSIKYFSGINNLANLIICVNDSAAVSIDTSWTKDPTASYTEICPNNNLIGYVKSDINNNCATDSLEPIVKNSIVQIIGPTDTIYTTPNTSGKYATNLDSGTYSISITSPYAYLNPCITPQSTTIDSINDLDTINWALQSSHYCPFLYASISTPFLRMAGGGSYYTISYCNYGTAPAYGAYIEVEIDSLLNVVMPITGPPLISQVGNLYTFDLDTLDIGECGSFDLNVIVDTSAQIGQMHCSEVHIYPDSLCNNSWTGPIIEAEGSCNNDTITFLLRNIGNPMIAPRDYVVIEDNLVMFTDPFTLGSGANTTIQVTAEAGKSYRIQAEQATGFPATLGPPIAYSNVQNCDGNSTTPAVFLQYYNGNTAPWIDTDCQANIAAYDPNDKATQQIGYGNQHYIGQNTPLDYKVRFQNTGNDTAFHVAIFDTISPHLDVSTLQMKTASHAYTWQIVDERTLRVDFPNIQLVDSTANEPLSHGFFRYEIQQNPNLPLETVINNEAAIYFDYNPPIFTNTTFHTIGENYIPLILNMEEAWVKEMQIHLYPNPTSGLVYIEQLLDEEIQIKVFDNLGRIVLQENMTRKKSTIDLNTLPQGIYYINIQQKEHLSTHKLVKY